VIIDHVTTMFWLPFRLLVQRLVLRTVMSAETPQDRYVSLVFLSNPSK